MVVANFADMGFIAFTILDLLNLNQNFDQPSV